MRPSVLPFSPTATTVASSTSTFDGHFVMNSLKLIDLVQSKDALWNPRSQFYHNREIKHLAWSDIALEMGVSRETVKTKWSSLRDSFRRELRKRSDPYYSGTKPEWALFNKMMFLAPFIYLKDGNPEGRFDDTFRDTGFGSGGGSTMPDFGVDLMAESPGTDHGGVSEISVDNHNRETNTIPRSTSVPTYTNFLKYSNPLTDFSNYSKLVMKKRLRKEKKKDEDYHFLMSLFSSMKRIPPEKKMTARIKIMQVLSELEVHNPSNTTNQTEENSSKTDIERVETSTSPDTVPASSIITVKEERFPNECDLTD